MSQWACGDQYGQAGEKNDFAVPLLLYGCPIMAY